MSLPRSLAGRVALALLAASLAIVLLDWTVAWWEQQRQPVRPHRGEPADAPVRAEPEAPRLATSGLRLPPVEGRIALVRRAGSLPPDVAPVVQILVDGSLVMRRAPPLAAGPLAVPGTSSSGLGGAVLLPDDELLSLPPAARAALLAVLGQWITERPVPGLRLEALDFTLPPGQLQSLLSWLP